MTNGIDGRSIAAGGAVGMALFAEHLLLYADYDALARAEPEIALLLSNGLGTLTIGAGLTVLALIEGRSEEIVHFWSIVIPAGTIVTAIRLWRRLQRLRLAAQARAGHAAGMGEGARIYGEAYRRTASGN